MHRRRAERKLVCRIGRSHRDDSLFSFPTYEFRRRAREVLSEGSEPQEFVNSVCNAGEFGNYGSKGEREVGKRQSVPPRAISSYLLGAVGPPFR